MSVHLLAIAAHRDDVGFTAAPCSRRSIGDRTRILDLAGES
jgi:hypothetical protein